MATNLQIKSIKQLHLKKYREKEGKFICEGHKIVTELFEEKPELIDKIYFTQRYKGKIDKSFEMISEKEMSQISALKTPSEILAICHIKASKVKSLNHKYYLYLDKISDPGNLGTIIRTCDWYGIDTVFISPESVDIYNPKVIQSTMASFFRIDCVICGIDELLEMNPNLQIIGADMKGDHTIYDYTSDHTTLIVMGSESHGISEDTKKYIHSYITIPRIGKAESLNVAVASSIIISHLID